MADMIGDSTMDHKVFNHPMLVGVPNKPEYSCADLAMLATILAEFDTSIDRQYSNMPRAFHLLSANEDLQKMLTEAWNMKSCKNVNFKALQPPVEPIPRLSFDQEKATENSWERTYVGHAAEALWTHIKTYYNPHSVDVYAHYVAVVQSSGMGKSRTVDELGKKHFSIPINLREANSTGYPPPDHSVRDFLTRNGSEAESYFRACCFMEALFEHTLDTLQGPDFGSHWSLRQVSEEFRNLMTTGQSMQGHNKFRREFYDNVVRLAEDKLRARNADTPKSEDEDELTASNKDTHKTEKKDDPPNISHLYVDKGNYNFRPAAACQKLEAALLAMESSSPLQVQPLRRITRSRDKADNVHIVKDYDPVIILAFDEAHTLTNRVVNNSATWSNFSTLRRVLRALHRFSLFSLFLSTTGKISQFTSGKHEDVSLRIILGLLILIQPFTDLGFDTLAHAIRLGLDLEEAAADCHMVHLGRPLFGARFDAGDLGVQEDIIKFAAGKLLNADTLVQPLTEDQALACLAQRLPIEFLSTNYVTRDVERKQVEGHMRVCLKIDAAFESMVTVSASEPILSEAAYFIMARPSFNAPVHLKSVLDGFSVHKGERGELVALLLLTLARDATVGPPGSDGRPNSRIFNMASFVSGHLFTASTSSPGLDLASAKALKALRKDFPHAVMHFNHFIKLHDFKSVDMKSLLFRMTRGAGVLCANSQYAVDVIQTFLCSGTTLCLDNGGLILSQIKLDSNYTHIPQWDLFSAMDLYNIGILKDGDPAVPVIRIIFSLAARTPGLTVVRHPPSSTYDAITYDIWCAGLSHDILGPVDKLYSHVWDALLQASYGWKELYKGSADKTGDLRRSMNPGAAMDAGHWSRWTQRN